MDPGKNQSAPAEVVQDTPIFDPIKAHFQEVHRLHQPFLIVAPPIPNMISEQSYRQGLLVHLVQLGLAGEEGEPSNRGTL
jgi:hypothetical protein